MLESLKGRTIGVVGWKDSGKTTVVEQLVGLLVSRGFKVGTVKHTHGDLLLQPETKDSTRHVDAGAEAAVVLGDGLVVFGKGGADDLERVVARHLSFCDVIVVEGLKHADIPKVAVVSDTDDILKETENVVAVVHRGSKPEGYTGFGLDDIKALVEFLLRKEILKPSAEVAAIVVDGKPVPINEFVQASLAGVIQGFVGALRDVESPSTIQIVVKLPK